jgi:hypothetical protein
VRHTPHREEDLAGAGLKARDLGRPQGAAHAVEQ